MVVIVLKHCSSFEIVQSIFMLIKSYMQYKCETFGWCKHHNNLDVSQSDLYAHVNSYFLKNSFI